MNEYLAKLNYLVETACLNYEYEVLTEAGEGEAEAATEEKKDNIAKKAASKVAGAAKAAGSAVGGTAKTAGAAVGKGAKTAGGKAAKFAKVAKKVIFMALKKAIQFIRALIQKMRDRLKFMDGKNATLQNDVTVYGGKGLTYDFEFINLAYKVIFVDKAKSGDVALFKRYQPAEEVHKAGEIISIDKIKRLLSRYDSDSDKIEKVTSKYIDMVDKDKYAETIGIVNGTTAHDGLTTEDLIGLTTDELKTIGTDVPAKLNKIVGSLNMLLDECIEVPKAVPAERGTDKKKEKAPKAKKVKAESEVKNESVDDASLRKLKLVKMLLEAADDLGDEEGLCDVDTCADDSMPEEEPEEAEEYPEEVSGGEGEDNDLEEIKELIGDDKEALDLLTKDEDSLTISEAIDSLFNF